jgi:hypothetical protein
MRFNDNRQLLATAVVSDFFALRPALSRQRVTSPAVTPIAIFRA